MIRDEKHGPLSLNSSRSVIISSKVCKRRQSVPLNTSSPGPHFICIHEGDITRMLFEWEDVQVEPVTGLYARVGF